MEGFFAQSIIYIVAAIVCVLITKRLGMSSILGYLFAGVLIGPYLLQFISNESEGQDIMHGTEFGVVMMLFLIGLELEPKNLWKMRDLILKIGLSQVLISAALLFGVAISLGVNWNISLAVALSMALSSTAIVLQSLKEKNQLDSKEGKMSFGVLLMQDIAVIPILAILPLLAISQATGDQEHANFLSDFPGWMQTAFIFSAIGVVVLLGRYAFGPLLHLVVKTRLRELFVAAALLIVTGIAFLMEIVGLSPALGTFLAGVILANSPYKHALETDLEPFKGLLLGLFFMAVGATINFDLVGNDPVKVFSLTLGVMVVKALVLFGIGYSKKLTTKENLNFAVGLAQVSEFSFVTYSFAFQLEIFSKEITDLLMAVTALSMALSPILMVILEKTIFKSLEKPEEKKASDADPIDSKNKVILLGFGNFGSTVGRFLRANGVEATILDFDPDRIENLRKMGFKVYFGDGTRVDLLESAGAEEAKILISAIDSTAHSKRIVTICKEHFPNLEVLIRARNRFDAYELMEMGIRNIYREHLDTSIRMGVDALTRLGHRAYTVNRLAHQFREYDEQALRVLVNYKNNKKEYISKVKKEIEIQEAMLGGELSKKFSLNDHAWDSEQMKDQNN